MSSRKLKREDVVYCVCYENAEMRKENSSIEIYREEENETKRNEKEEQVSVVRFFCIIP